MVSDVYPYYRGHHRHSNATNRLISFLQSKKGLTITSIVLSIGAFAYLGGSSPLPRLSSRRISSSSKKTSSTAAAAAASSLSIIHRSLEDNFIPLELSPFKGTPWRTPETLEVVPVVATSFGVCEIHKVKTEDGKELEGWLWFDEKDQINVLAQLATPPSSSTEKEKGGKGEEGGEKEKGKAASFSTEREGKVEVEQEKKFLVFEQKKYGYEGLSLAPIGGLIEPGEEPLEAAKRELLEEAGLESEGWVYLGKYRISSTRGGGFLNVFLAQDCRPSKDAKFSDDMEKQTKKLLTEEEITEQVLAGGFKEAKWTQTVTMGLFWLSRERSRRKRR